MDDLMVRMAEALRASAGWLYGHDNAPGQSKRRYLNATLLAEYDALKAQPSLVKSGGGVEQPSEIDTGCICKGNWRLIVKGCRHLIGERFSNGEREFTFFGVVLSDDDYYYGMQGDETLLLSCVGSIETHGFSRVDQALPASSKSPSTADVAEARPALGGETGITNGPWMADGDVGSWIQGLGYACSWVNSPNGRWTQAQPTTGAEMARQMADAAFIADACNAALAAASPPQTTGVGVTLPASSKSAPDPVSHTTGQEKG